tara:strand:- start:136 stop:1179 length:1044 start_codon:yes stop_codon:yes gene_type:complete
MSTFRILDTAEDIVNNSATVTSGVFQDGDSSITSFFTSSVQSGSTGDYSLDVFKFNPQSNASASVQFGVAYGHFQGSGSVGGVGVAGERPSAAVYGQFNQLINPPQTQKFTFGTHEADDIFVLTFNRARIRETLQRGGWELHLSGSGVPGVIKLIDDSSTNKGGNTSRRNFSPEYNIVSGSLTGGTTIKDESSDDSTFGTYGLFYPEIGTLVLNPNRVESQITKVGTRTSLVASGSNSDGGNNDAFYETIKGGAFFQAKREETISSRHFFIRATANRFNATTNESYYTESIAGVKRIIPGLQNDPKTFITTVGLYNDADELLAVAKLSKPIIKSRSREALIKVKLDF